MPVFVDSVPGTRSRPSVPVSDTEVRKCTRVCFLAHFDMLYFGQAGTDAAPGDDTVHVFGLALEDGLDTSVGRF